MLEISEDIFTLTEEYLTVKLDLDRRSPSHCLRDVNVIAVIRHHGLADAEQGLWGLP